MSRAIVSASVFSHSNTAKCNGCCLPKVEAVRGRNGGGAGKGKGEGKAGLLMRGQMRVRMSVLCTDRAWLVRLSARLKKNTIAFRTLMRVRFHDNCLIFLFFFLHEVLVEALN